MRAPANAPGVHGDKEKPELTRQYNEGYKTDLAEPHANSPGNLTSLTIRPQFDFPDHSATV